MDIAERGQSESENKVNERVLDLAMTGRCDLPLTTADVAHSLGRDQGDMEALVRLVMRGRGDLAQGFVLKHARKLVEAFGDA